MHIEQLFQAWKQQRKERHALAKFRVQVYLSNGHSGEECDIAKWSVQIMERPKLKGLKSSHSLVKDLSRGFSMTEHVESELLLLLLPGKQKCVPQKNPERKKHADGKLVLKERNPEGPETYFKKAQVPIKKHLLGSLPDSLQSHHFPAQNSMLKKTLQLKPI